MFDYKEEFTEIIEFRSIIRKWTNEVINDRDMNYILTAANKAPSAFGLDFCKLKVVSNKATQKLSLNELTTSRVDLINASHVVALGLRVKDLYPDSDYIRSELYENLEFDRKGVYSSKSNRELFYKKFIDNLPGYYKHSNLDSSIFSWAKEQSAYVASYIMMAAASINIDSCLIQSFQYNKVKDFFDIEEGEELGCLIALGFRAEDRNQKEVHHTIKYIN